MNNEDAKPIEGEVIEKKSLGSARDENSRPAGIFIGTLNIMAAPAREYVTEPLGELYKARYHGKYKRPKHVFALDLGLVALGIAIGAVAIYFAFIWKPAAPSAARLAVLPNHPASGGEVVINLSFYNDSESALTGAMAAFKLPKEVKFLRSSLPYRREEGTAALGTIEPKSEITERLVGFLEGGAGKNLKVLTYVTYTESATGNVRSASASAAFKVSESNLGANFELPDELAIGQAVNGSVRYWNRGAEAENVVLTPSWPAGFALSTASSPLKAGRWELGKLSAGSEGKIEFSGVLRKADRQTEFSLMTGTREGGKINEESSSVKSIEVNDPLITVKLDGKTAARLGETLALTATYENNGERTLSDAALKPLAENGITVSGGRAEKFSLKPGEKGTATFEIKLPSSLPEDLKNSTDPQLALRVSLDGKLDNDNAISIQAPAFAVKIASSLDLNSVVRYWSETGDQLGRGPLPPETGKATRYWVFWNVQNTTGAVTGVRVSAALPANVSFTGKVSAPFGEAPKFDPGSRNITWMVGDIPAWPGTTSASIGTAFEIALIPTPEQSNTYPPLLRDQKISGTDSASGLPLSGSASDLSAHLLNDPKAADTGTVK